MAKFVSTNYPDSNGSEHKEYVSCIKLHGLRILPPILTEERRQKMHYYKKLAIKIEEKLRLRRIKQKSERRRNKSQYSNDSDDSSNSSKIFSSDTSSGDVTFKSQFSESCQKDVLKMLNGDSSTLSNELPCLDNAEISNVPLNATIDSKSIKLNENQRLQSNVRQNSYISDSNLIFNKETLQDVTTNLDEMDENISPPPLIRSNSYTLEKPSPYLLALLQENARNATPASDNSNESISSHKRKSWDLKNAREKWSSNENDLHVEKNHFNSLPASTATSPVPLEKYTEVTKKSTLLHLPEKESKIPTKDKQKINAIMNLSKNSTAAKYKNVSLQNIRNKPKNSFFKTHQSTPILNQDNHHKKTETFTKKKSSISAEKLTLPKKPDILGSQKSEQQIRDIIDKIQMEQTRQMMILLARQKNEQENLMRTFGEQQAVLLSQLKPINRTLKKEDIKTIENDFQNYAKKSLANIRTGNDIVKQSNNFLNDCKEMLQITDLNNKSNESVQANSSDHSTTPTDTTMKSDQTDSECCIKSDQSDPTIQQSGKKTKPNSLESVELFLNSYKINKQAKMNKTKFMCSRRLFPSDYQHQAATKINSLVRGYLVRRIIKTEKVQNLIQTIRDTLVCAMELHHETTENIQPADVELHRRLIQQVTAACYSFHGVFFQLTKKEQMQLIYADRERQKEKLLRPASAVSNSSSLSSTTLRILERKQKRRSSDTSNVTSMSKSFSTRITPHQTNGGGGEFRARTKSLGVSDVIGQGDKKKISPPYSETIRRSVYHGATNRKPWK